MEVILGRRKPGLFLTLDTEGLAAYARASISTLAAVSWFNVAGHRTLKNA